MARSISITSPYQHTDQLLAELQQVPHLLQLQVFRGASVSPPGDVIQLAIPNGVLNRVMRLLDGYQLGKPDGISVSTSEPASMVPSQPSYPIERDNNEASWEEMELTISNDTNATANTLLTMAVAGALATVGIATGALHIVIGGMLVAPGFMPISRIALGLVGRHPAWYFGIIDLLKGYLALVIGAVIMGVVLKLAGHPPLASEASYYSLEQTLVQYWSSVTLPSALSSAAASVAGALLLATQKSVFTSGVMIGLALVPSAALVGLGALEADLVLVLSALVRFVVELALVFAFSLLVFGWLRFYVHKRNIQV